MMFSDYCDLIVDNVIYEVEICLVVNESGVGAWDTHVQNVARINNGHCADHLKAVNFQEPRLKSAQPKSPH